MSGDPPRFRRTWSRWRLRGKDIGLESLPTDCRQRCWRLSVRLHYSIGDSRRTYDHILCLHVSIFFSAHHLFVFTSRQLLVVVGIRYVHISFSVFTLSDKIIPSNQSESYPFKKSPKQFGPFLIWPIITFIASIVYIIFLLLAHRSDDTGGREKVLSTIGGKLARSTAHSALAIYKMQPIFKSSFVDVRRRIKSNSVDIIDDQQLARSRQLRKDFSFKRNKQMYSLDGLLLADKVFQLIDSYLLIFTLIAFSITTFTWYTFHYNARRVHYEPDTLAWYTFQFYRTILGSPGTRSNTATSKHKITCVYWPRLSSVVG